MRARPEALDALSALSMVGTRHFVVKKGTKRKPGWDILDVFPIQADD